MSHKTLTCETLTYNTLQAMVGLKAILGSGLLHCNPCTVIDFVWPDCTLVFLSDTGRILHGVPIDDVEIHKDDQKVLIKRLTDKNGG